MCFLNQSDRVDESKLSVQINNIHKKVGNYIPVVRENGVTY